MISAVELFCSLAVGAGYVSAQPCPDLTDEVRSRVAAYVADRYEFAPDLKVEDEGIVGGSCFRRITIRVSAPKQSLQLFLSSDQRFLSETLLDTTVSPTAERQRVARETELALGAESSPFLGPENAPVTLVEFSDFQCPFCKRLTDVIERLPDNDRGSVKIVFKHRPLAIHPWARRAALASICVSLESYEAFWSLEKFLFANQDTITSLNLEDKIAAFAKESQEINFSRMRRCLAEETAEKILLRDEKLAELYHVDAIPTVFVNGVRSVGSRSMDELRAVLHAAGLNSASGLTSKRDSPR